LKKTLVCAGGTKVAKGAYEGIVRKVAEGRKEEACMEATELLISGGKVDRRIVGDVVASLNKIRNRRGAGPFHVHNPL
jgi:hypothetical protein